LALAALRSQSLATGRATEATAMDDGARPVRLLLGSCADKALGQDANITHNAIDSPVIRASGCDNPPSSIGETLEP
jgi:hypothetical protein